MTSAVRYRGHYVRALHEPELDGWTAWVDGGCVMRLLGGPKVRHSEKAALALAKAHVRACDLLHAEAKE